MVSRASGGLGDDTIEPQCRQIQFVDECFNNPDRVVLGHVVIQAVRKQRSLPPVLAFHKTFHLSIPNSRTLDYHARAFHTPSVDSGPSQWVSSVRFSPLARRCVLDRFETYRMKKSRRPGM